MNFYDYVQTGILTLQLAITSWSRRASFNTSYFDYIISHEYYDNPRQNADTIPVVRLGHTIDNFIVQVTPNFNFINTANPILSLAIDSLIIVSLFAIIAWTLIGGLNMINRRFNILSFIYRFFTVIENEFNAPRGFLIIISLLSSTLLLGVFLPVFSLKTPLIVYTFMFLFASILFTIILWPISLVYNWGAYFSIYIKGESTMSNLLGQVVMDYFYVVSFFLRINLQFLRLVILSGVFIVYNEFYFEFIYPNYNFESINYNTQTWDDYIYIGLKFIITAALRFIYELGHMWVVVIMQANAFSMILFLILQSLHTVYLSQRMLAYFKNKRKAI